jgi:hypothetical protein
MRIWKMFTMNSFYNFDKNEVEKVISYECLELAPRRDSGIYFLTVVSSTLPIASVPPPPFMYPHWIKTKPYTFATASTMLKKLTAYCMPCGEIYLLGMKLTATVRR